MKKTRLFISIVILSTIFFQDFVIACTNLLITKGASKDGSTMISYTADSHTLYGELYHWPAAKWPEGTMMDIYEWDTGKFLGQIKQAAETYNVVGNMNEWQVAIGETTYGGREELRDTTGIIDYGSLIYIALQRAKTAREAIEIMTTLVAEYGYHSEGESFSISDPNEVWIMEMIGKGPGRKGAVWVAMKIPDGYICSHANQARIQTFPLNDPENCLYAPDVISFAREKGYFKGQDKEFSFSDTYAPVDFSGARFCEARVWSIFNRVKKGFGEKYLKYAMGYDLKNRMPLWIKPDEKIGLYDAFELMRDHYQGTPMDMTKDFGAGPYACPYRWRPLTWKVDGKQYFNERAISTQQTGFSFITQSRSWLPNVVGGINWFGVDDTYSTVYTPMYTCITQVPPSLAEGNGSMMEFSDSAMFWIFNQVSNFAYTRYKDMIPEIRSLQKELEMNYINNTAEIDQKALELYNQNPEEAVKFLTEYSVSKGQMTFTVWKDFYKTLFTKFMDGNIKVSVPDQKFPKVSQPGYSPEFYKEIVKQAGERFRVPGGPTH